MPSPAVGLFEAKTRLSEFVARAEAGERITPYSLMSARMALGLPGKAPGQRAGQGV